MAVPTENAMPRWGCRVRDKDLKDAITMATTAFLQLMYLLLVSDGRAGRQPLCPLLSMERMSWTILRSVFETTWKKNNDTAPPRLHETQHLSPSLLETTYVTSPVPG